MLILLLKLTANNPVMVYIHGGGLEKGSSQIAPPNYLLEKDVVLVVPQYRLGPLGFLSTQTDDIPGNAGLQDIVLSLQWCQMFITRFGGDPNRITLFGQSSGAALVSALILSSKVPDSLFHKVILQSGSILSARSFDYDSVKNARNIAKLCECDTNNALIRDINKCLMKVDVIKLLRAHQDHMVCKKNLFEKILRLQLTVFIQFYCKFLFFKANQCAKWIYR